MICYLWLQWKREKCLSHTTTVHLIYSKCHNYVRLLVNDFSLAPWITQIGLHLQKQRNVINQLQQTASGHRMKHIN